MRITDLELHDVRSYAQAHVRLEPGTNLFVGQNGQGKTNLLEAVLRAATGSSHRVAGDGPLVRAGADVAVVRVAFVADGGTRRRLDVQFGGGRRPRVRLDGQDVRRASDAVGVLRVVVFAPEDMEIVRGTPGARRAFVDGVLAQRRPLFAATASEYDRVLRQRTALLKQLRHDRTLRSTLATWTDELVRVAAPYLAARIAALHALSGPVDAAYAQLTGGQGGVAIAYVDSTGARVAADPDRGVPPVEGLVDRLRVALAERADEEIARGVTLVGPHRDDLDLVIGGLSARHHASQGEAWSLALALRLGSHDLLATDGDRPVVLLDDVFAELDAQRRERLATACQAFEQVLVTAAVEQDVPLPAAAVQDVHRDEDGTSRVVPRTVRDRRAS